MEKIVKCLQNSSVEIYKLLQSHRLLLSKNSEILASSDKIVNASGDIKKEMDIFADQIFENNLIKLNEELINKKEDFIIAEYASEERDNVISLLPLRAHFEEKVHFVLAIDPLDGSQNLDVGLTVGCIFSVFKAKSFDDVTSGRDIFASGYALFSCPLIFCFAASFIGKGVQLSQYNFQTKEFEIVLSNHSIPNKGKIYSINEGLAAQYDDLLSAYVSTVLKSSRSVRWMSCMVADVHRNMLEGGCFIYPIDRLRLLYECYPMAYLWEQAGGSSMLNLNDCDTSLLDTAFTRTDLHEKVTVCLLGPFERMKLGALKKTLPKWVGGKDDDLLKTAKIEVSEKAKTEINFLKVALGIGLIAQIFMYFRR